MKKEIYMKRRGMFVFAGLFVLMFSFFTLTTVTNAEEVDQPSLVTVNDGPVTVGPLMTFDEMLAEIASNRDISVEQAEEEIIGNSEEDADIARGKQYRSLSQQFTVTSNYKPSMRFYCETTESGWFRGIVKILEVDMVRSYDGKSKQFNGNVYVNLEDANRIFYIVNGDYYNNGTTSYNSNVNIGVGQVANVGFGVNYASNHYKYCYNESRLNF